ncbi:hypothetical protein ERJ77_24380 [Vibrio anguillarum]|nr:hypothetical protein [Vibrio anguillarum]
MGGFQLLVFKRDIVNDYCFEGVKKIFLNVLLKHYDTPYSNILKRAVQSEESWSEPSRFSFNKDERSEEEKQKVATIIESWVRESFEQAKLSLGFNVDGVNWEYQLTNDSRKIKLLYFKNQGNTVEITINLAFDNKSMTNKVLMKTRTSFKRKFKHQTELKLVGSMKDKFMLNEILPFAAKVIISLGEGSLQTEKEQLAVLIGNWSFDSLDKNDAVK